MHRVEPIRRNERVRIGEARANVLWLGAREVGEESGLAFSLREQAETCSTEMRSPRMMGLPRKMAGLPSTSEPAQYTDPDLLQWYRRRLAGACNQAAITFTWPCRPYLSIR